MRRVRYYLGGALFWGAFLAVCVLLFWNAQRLARAAGGISLRYGEALEPRVVASALEYARDGRNNAAWSPTFWAVRQGAASANGREETVRMLRVCGDAELLATEPLLYGALPGPAGQGGCAVSSALAWQLWGALDVTGLELELDGERYTVRGVFESGEARAVTQEAADSRTAEYANVELTAMETAPEGTEAALAFAGASGLGTPAHVVDGPALAGLACALALFLILYVLIKGVPHLSWELVSTKPSYLSDTIGILPDIISTLCMVLTTLLFVLPLGVCAAVYLTEYAANKRVVAVIEYAAETLSGIPSIIYGLVGQMFFCQFLGMKKSLIAGAMTLVIMNLPTIMRTTQESLKTVPQSYREGAFGLGAGKWRVIRTVVLPGCVDGVITGCILAVGRILGETAALLYTAGFAHTLYSTLGETLQSSGATLSVALYVYAKEQGEFDVAFAIAAILMVLALIIDIAAALVGKYFQRRRSI